MDVIDRQPGTVPTTTPAAGATSYHRLGRLEPRTARWWSPLAATGLAVLLYLAAMLLLVLASVLVTALTSPSGVFVPTEELTDPLNPADWTFSLGVVALMLPAVVLGVRWSGRRGGTLHSVEGRFRWRLALRAALAIGPLYAVVIWTVTLLAPPEDLSVPALTPALLLSVLAILLLGPLQCAAEEYVFRGLPQQVLGTWLRSPVWGIVLPVPLFVLGHGYDVWGQISIAVFALATGFLVWKSGGLELAVVVHVANNMAIYAYTPFSPSSLQQGETSPWVLLVDLPLQLGAVLGLTWWVSRTHGLRFLEPVRRPAY